MTENLRIFHKTIGVERALIWKLVLAVEEKYITAMSNSTTDQFTGTLFMIIQYLIVTYSKIYPIQLVDLEQNNKSMQYDPQTPIDTFFNQVKNILEYGELDISPYTHIHKNNISYIIINRTRKFQDAIKTWNRMNPIQQNWINFKPIFAHLAVISIKLANSQMEAVGYHQSKLFNNIVAHMSGLPFPYPPQDPEYTSTPNPYPTIVPTV